MKKSPIIYLPLIFLSLFYSCFTLTKSIARKAKGIHRPIFNEIIEVKQLSSNDIVIISKVRYTDKRPKVYDNLSLETRCFSLKIEDYNPQINLNYIIDPTYVIEKCIYPLAKNLKFKYLREYEFNAPKLNNSSKLINIAFVDREGLLIQIELDDRDNTQKQTYEVKNAIYKNPKPYYQFLYLAAIPYDILSGSLHAIGAPFYVGALLINGVHGDPKFLPIYKKLPFYLLFGTYKVLSFLDLGIYGS